VSAETDSVFFFSYFFTSDTARKGCSSLLKTAKAEFYIREKGRGKREKCGFAAGIREKVRSRERPVFLIKPYCAFVGVGATTTRAE
jgi:hypothetical protein